jgi:hypothetical protein
MKQHTAMPGFVLLLVLVLVGFVMLYVGGTVRALSHDAHAHSELRAK